MATIRTIELIIDNKRLKFHYVMLDERDVRLWQMHKNKLSAGDKLT